MDIRRLSPRKLGVLGLLAAGLQASLAACSSTPAAIAAQKCPTPYVLAEAASSPKFAPGGAPSAQRIVMTADLYPPTLDCDFDEGSQTNEIRARFAMRFTPGPAANGQPQQFTYFIAQADADNNIIVKRLFSVSASEAGTETIANSENVFAVATGKRPTDYRFLMGFQLGADELAYERARMNRTAAQ